MGGSADRLLGVLVVLSWLSACAVETPAATPATSAVAIAAGVAGDQPVELTDVPGDVRPVPVPEPDAPEPDGRPRITAPRVEVLGAATCVDAPGDVWAASGAPVSVAPSWADVTALHVELGPATSLLRWELADLMPVPAYGESDAFAWSTWTVVFEGDEGRLHVTARLDRDVWWAVHHLADASAPEVESAVHASGRTIDVVFSSQDLAELGAGLRWFGLAEVGPPGQRVDPVFDRWNDLVCSDDPETPFSSLGSR